MSDRIKEIFVDACDLPPDQRGAFLDQQAGGDAALRAKVQSLLDAHDRALGFMAEPTVASSPGTRGALMPAAPRQIGPYKILQEIGEGGFGTVYLAEQETPVRRRVALKIIKAGMDTRQVIARFEAERQALAIMDHPNIARVLDAGATDGGLPYFVMELVKGVPITRYCDETQLPIDSRLLLFVQVCDAVQHAHQKGIIHRDIKPTNVLVSNTDDKPLVKVIDFGIAKATQVRLTEKTLFTEFRQMIGTPEYMSPEQADVGGLDVDTRSDVYSLGVLLYELLAGVTPFEPSELRAQAYGEIQRIIREVEPPRPSTRLSTLDALPTVAANRHVEPRQLRSKVQGELDWIVMKCLEKDRGRRYESVSALVSDVQHHLADEPIRAHPTSSWYRLRKAVRRHKGPVIAIAAVVLALVAGVIGTTLGMFNASKQEAIAQQHAIEAKRQADNASAISKFQSDMLSSADPDRFFGQNVTVLQVIDAAVRQLDHGSLKDQPLVEAEVRLTIAQTLQSLACYDKAEPNYRRSLQLYRDARGEGHRDVTRVLSGLGINCFRLNRLDEAEKFYNESLEIERRHRPESDPDYAADLVNMGMLLKFKQEPARSEELFQEALGIYRRLLRPDDPSIALALTDLGMALQDQGKLAEAETALRESLEINRKTLPAKSTQLAFSLGNLADVLLDENRLEEAEPLAVQTLNNLRSTLPANHPEVAKAVMVLANLRRAQGRLPEAEALFVESIAIHRASLSGDHPDLATMIHNLGNIYWNEKKLDQAEAAFREALGIYLKTFPLGHELPSSSQVCLAWVLKDQGRFADAEAVLRETLAAMKQSGQSDTETFAKGQFVLGMSLMGLKRPVEAESPLLDAERIYAGIQDRYGKRYLQIAEVLTRLYNALNASSPGSGYEEKARKWASLLPATNPTTAPASNPSTRPS